MEKCTVVEWHDCTNASGQKVRRVQYTAVSGGHVIEAFEDLPVIIGPDDWEADPWVVDEFGLSPLQDKLYKQIQSC